MDADWITSPSARRVLQHAADSRPAWLWSQDGQSLLWQNDAAPLFLAKLKKHGLKRAAPAIPIKGQIARNIRLGSTGRSSLARIQFLAGDKPASSTCATTPLLWQDGQPVLLVVGVDPIAPDLLAAAQEAQDLAGEPVAVDDTVEATDAQPEQNSDEMHPDAMELHLEDVPAEPVAETPEPPQAPQDEVAAARQALDEADTFHFHDDRTVLSTGADAYAQELENWREAEHDDPAPFEPALVKSSEPTQDKPDEPVVEHSDAQTDGLIAIEPEDADPEVSQVAAGSRLSRLVERLAADEALFTPLTEADDAPPAGRESLHAVAEQNLVPEPEQVDQPVDMSDADADVESLAAVDGVDPAELSVEDTLVSTGDEPAEAASDLAKPAADPDTVERVSRYNFDELARILTDRVGDAAPVVAPPPPPASEPARTGALINLGGETLVLNRLPLGILVFRDQQVLFANRAITEMVGYESVESLRSAGLAAVFPAAGPDGAEGAGPVNHLVQRDGTLVPVTARLQSISWQGKPALMLSASTTEVRTGHEAAVAAFAHTVADLRGDGFFEATRTGAISAITQRSASLLNEPGMLEGKLLSALVASSELASLRDFLERPARFAETARPCLTLRAATGNAEIALFAQGQAGVVTGYFGFIRARETAPLVLAAPTDTDPALLARISRGVRRPLNTIIGFADLIRSEAFGALANERYETYAQDITVAGQEIAALVDELDDFARLRDGRYLPQRASIELTSLLESCVLRIRQQASGARVIVRNAISESLPRVTADRASLAQAVLNLLASAIDQTPTGGGVVISAQREDDGGIAIHVRDSSTNAVDMAERFVVFRDGMGRNGQMMVPVRSSIGLALTRSLLAVNAFTLSVDPAGEQGMLFTLIIPADLVEQRPTPDVAE